MTASRNAAGETRPGLTVIYLGHGVNDTCWFILPALLPLLIERFGLGYGTAGALLSGFLGVVALGSFLLGRLPDRLPRRKVLAAGFFLSAAGLAGLGLSAGLAGFLPWLAVTAAGVSTFHTVMITWLEEFARRQRGRVFSLFEFWGQVSILSLFLLFGTLLVAAGAKALLLLAGLVNAGAGLLFLLAPGAPAEAGETAAASGEAAEETAAGVAAAPPAPPAGASMEAAAPNALGLALLLAATGLRTLGLIGLLDFLPTWLVREAGLSVSLASYGTGLYFTGGVLAVRLAGRWMDRHGPLPVLAAGMVALAPLAFGLSLGPAPALLAGMLLFMGGSSAVTVPAQSLVLAGLTRSGRAEGPSRPASGATGRAFGLLMGLTALTHSLGPLLFGLLAEGRSLGAAMRLTALPLLAGLALLLPLFLRPEVRRMAA